MKSVLLSVLLLSGSFASNSFADYSGFLWHNCADNNCYNYALGIKANNFAQPGEASGKRYGVISCQDRYGELGVYHAAKNDGLIPTDSPDKCTSEQNTVALVVAPDMDFHWYRRESNGQWLHKRGSTNPTDLDYDDKIITDVRKANRGPYTDFCGYFCVDYDQLKVK